MQRILFVDDDSHILDELRRTLSPLEHEWEMAFAHGGEAAITLLDAAPFEVLVSDLKMPGIDGATLLRLARDKHPDILRIILSEPADLEASFRTVPVAHQFLRKPCDPNA